MLAMTKTFSCSWFLSRYLRGGPTPAEIHTLTFGDEEQVVPDLSKVLVEKGDYAE
jgi:hypothetical protein